MSGSRRQLLECLKPASWLVSILSVLLGHRALRAEIPASEPPALRLRPAAEWVVVGDPAGTDISVTLAGDVQAEAGALPRVVASIGEIVSVERAGDQSYVVVYRPPSSHPPAVALFVASLRVAGSVLYGAATLELHSPVDVVVRAEPNVAVRIEAGPRRFGPRRVRRSGRVVFRVPIAPGTRGYSIELLGKNRDTTREWVELPAPDWPRLVIAALPSITQMSKTGELEVATVAIEPDGRLKAAGELSCELGGEHALERIAKIEAPAIFRTSVDQLWGEELTIRCWTADGAQASSVLMRPGKPVVLALAAPRSFVAGSNPVAVMVHAKDESGRPTVLPKRLELSVGMDNGWKHHSEHVRPPESPYESILSVELPAKLDGARAARLAVVGGSPEVSGAELEMRLIPGPPASIEAPSALRAVVADGRTSLTLTPIVSDSFGNRLPLPDAVAKVGKIEEKDGKLVYMPPRLYEPAEDVIAIRSGDVAHTTRVELLPDPRWLVGAHLGWLVMKHGASAPTIDLELSWSGAFVEPFARVAVGRGRITTDLADSEGNATLDDTWWVSAATLGVARELFLGSSSFINLGLGCGAQLTRSEVRVTRAESVLQPGQIETVIRPTVTARSAFGIRIGSWRPRLALTLMLGLPTGGPPVSYGAGIAAGTTFAPEDSPED